ncbi:cathepsin J-like [Tropilaelaps mercedesae]|uniref:Cathepsin J-like n=1 Tax=Tropilaelaps mercedesae TaxID=418985 RepID=A0A1V9XCR9_9ACAR|nr:cathepsin J-like [Tropilaelaps mercedesae]
MDISPSPFRILYRLRLGLVVVPIAIALGHYLEKKDDQNMTRFRGKSKLYGKPGHQERPPW